MASLQFRHNQHVWWENTNRCKTDQGWSFLHNYWLENDEMSEKIADCWSFIRQCIYTGSMREQTDWSIWRRWLDVWDHLLLSDDHHRKLNRNTEIVLWQTGWIFGTISCCALWLSTLMIIPAFLLFIFRDNQDLNIQAIILLTTYAELKQIIEISHSCSGSLHISHCFLELDEVNRKSYLCLNLPFLFHFRLLGLLLVHCIYCLSNLCL